jgi:uncharacterized protein involved in exopolysaccharide biosynthesis/Mrp family chromosome partitioning ATPase
MSQPKPVAPPPSLNVQDVFYVLFKHKWKILVSAVIGICAAAAVYFLAVRVYESQAKLLVRYVVDTSAIDHVDSRATVGPSSENLINSEVEILTSWDLAVQVANAVGVERLLPRSEGAADVSKAARNIRLALTVSALKGTNIILVSYRNKDPQLATLVLNELISRYFTKHLEVHRSADAFNFVTQQSDQVLAHLNQTEEELRQLKSKAGIASLAESAKTLNVELGKTREALQAAETERAEQQAVVQELEKSVTGQGKDPHSVPLSETNGEAVQQYHTLLDRLSRLRETEMGLLAKYLKKPDQPNALGEVEGERQVRGVQGLAAMNRARGMAFIGSERDMAQALARERYRRQNDTGFAYQGGKKSFDTLVKEAEQEILGQKNREALDAKQSESQLVKLNQVQIENLEKQRSDLEKRFPGIAASLPTALSQNAQLDLSTERARLDTERSRVGSERTRLAGIEARVNALRSRLSDVQKESEKLSELGPQVEQLERTKEIEETNYKYFQASLEKARIDEALDPSKMPNISVVQSPSTAFKVTGEVKRLVLGLAGGGIALGLAFAFLIELVLNRTVKRPLELEALLGIPLWLSIPNLNGREHLRLRGPGAGKKSIVALKRNGHFHAAPWESDHFIRPFAEAIRDRLILYFQLNRMNHKPKLIAVTDFSEGAGASTLAAGLAAALSETGDGKVLLVDMNVGCPEIHPFSRGTPSCSLAEALTGTPAPAGENLYLAVAASPDAPEAQIIPKRFYDLMPHLKASDFDYIIFDMPTLSQTSITLPMSGLMDKVIVVGEAEKSIRDIVKRSYQELVACKANVSVILNKGRSYTPKWLGTET